VSARHAGCISSLVALNTVFDVDERRGMTRAFVTGVQLLLAVDVFMFTELLLLTVLFQ
jgi:hypothetical protein